MFLRTYRRRARRPTAVRSPARCRGPPPQSSAERNAAISRRSAAAQRRAAVLRVFKPRGALATRTGGSFSLVGV